MFQPSPFLTAHPSRPLRAPESAGVDVSVIIVSYNTRVATLQAVGSVLDHAGSVRVEVIVVDNASSDDSATVVQAAYPQVRVIASGHNGGYGWANNLGIGRARGRHILVLNPDALMHADSLARAVAYLDAHPEVGILGARVFLDDGTQQSTLFRGLRLPHLFWRTLVPSRLIRESRFFGDQRYASRDRDSVQDVEVVAGCFMMVPRRVIAQVGAMDDRFFMYSEESEWCWRVRRAGHVVRYHPGVTITHHGALSTGQVSAWKAVEIAKGHILYLRFTGSPVAAWAGTALMAAGDALRSPWIVLRCLGGRKDQMVEVWRARLGFLLRALLRQPRGQKPPPAPPAAEADVA